MKAFLFSCFCFFVASEPEFEVENFYIEQKRNDDEDEDDGFDLRTLNCEKVEKEGEEITLTAVQFEEFKKNEKNLQCIIEKIKLNLEKFEMKNVRLKYFEYINFDFCCENFAKNENLIVENANLNNLLFLDYLNVNEKKFEIRNFRFKNFSLNFLQYFSFFRLNNSQLERFFVFPNVVSGKLNFYSTLKNLQFDASIGWGKKFSLNLQKPIDLKLIFENDVKVLKFFYKNKSKDFTVDFVTCKINDMFSYYKKFFIDEQIVDFSNVLMEPQKTSLKIFFKNFRFEHENKICVLNDLKKIAQGQTSFGYDFKFIKTKVFVQEKNDQWIKGVDLTIPFKKKKGFFQVVKTADFKLSETDKIAIELEHKKITTSFEIKQNDAKIGVKYKENSVKIKFWKTLKEINLKIKFSNVSKFFYIYNCQNNCHLLFSNIFWFIFGLIRFDKKFGILLGGKIPFRFFNLTLVFLIPNDLKLDFNFFVDFNESFVKSIKKFEQNILSEI